MATLEEIRNKIRAQQERRENRGTGTGGDRAMFPFWNTPEGETTTLRFLPDADPDNTFFWVERLIIKLPFQGIRGEHDREVSIQVPCLEMYGMADPIITEINPWWKDDSLKDLARKYYKKRSYLFQGFVVNSAFQEENVPENPIRRFTINKEIYDIIYASLMNPDMEDSPTDYVNGRDFKLTKTTKGQFANYNTSSWSFKTRGLSEQELEAIEKYGLYNLKDYLPEKPTPEKIEVIKEMFQASVNEEAYDPKRWGEYYRPWGYNGDSNSSTVQGARVESSTPAASSAPASTGPTLVEETPEPVATPAAPAASTGKPDASEILRRLKERQQG